MQAPPPLTHADIRSQVFGKYFISELFLSRKLELWSKEQNLSVRERAKAQSKTK